MSKSELAGLTAEVRALREEVQRLREAQSAHVCQQFHYHYPQAPAYPQQYWGQPGTIWVGDVPNICQGAADNGWQTLTINAS